jgi:hypothetical protein
MTYDIFISYASEDAAWAARLEQDLKDAGRTVFRDVTRLQVGRRFESQLTAALDQSQHFVVIWSSSANASNWVQREMGRFDNLAGETSRRRFICLNLEGRNEAYTPYQHIEVRSGPDIAALDVNEWRTALSAIRTAIDADDDVEPIETVVLAIRENEADPAQPGGFSPQNFADIEHDFGLTQAQVRERYQGTSLDWHPYGGPRTVRALLDELVDSVNNEVAAALPEARFVCRPVGDDEWWTITPQGRMESRMTEVASRLARAKLSLVVIDALSLQVNYIYRRAIALREYLKSSNSTWIFVPPLPSEPTMLRYRELVRTWSEPLLNAYFKPPVPRRDPRTPQFGVFCGDGFEMQRLMLGAVGDYLAADDQAGDSPYTSYRGRR